MILEFAEDQYVDVDLISCMRWLKTNDAEFGIVVINNSKITIIDREQFDVIKSAYIWTHKSHMVDDKLKKIHWKRGKS